jgi:methionine biosynthesis protein MetW
MVGYSLKTFRKSTFHAIRKIAATIYYSFNRLYAHQEIGNLSVDYDLYWKSKRAASKLGTCNVFQKKRAKWIAERIESGSIVFDLGCGDGAVLKKISTTKDIAGVGIDDSDYALKSVKEFGFKSIKGDVSIPGVFKLVSDADHILLLEILEHISESETLLLESLHHARKSVFFSFPNTGYISYRLRMLFGRFPVQWRIHPNEHVRFWTYADLIWWLGELGLLEQSSVEVYEGVPILNRVFKGLFGAAFIVEVKIKK